MLAHFCPFVSIRRVLLLCLVVIVNLACGCSFDASNPPSVDSSIASVPSESPHIVVHIYFGLSEQGGTPILESQWLEFETQVLAEKFDGFTLYDAKGYFNGKSEGSKVVVLVTNEEDLLTVRQVSEIYRHRFNQHSVMVTVSSLQQWLFIEADNQN
ncbi:DUF3574 domain-containing protein [Thalassotalea litorea]|uniref:DUF3574 domain-containing protein n=1 Tax=Thalassotalea litorea TaxID=2020715 RepID=UPI0037362220